MPALKASFEKMGFSNVITYIQSGNVLFSSGEKDKTKLTYHIEQNLSSAFNYKSKVVVVSENQLKNVVQKAPGGFGKNPDEYGYDVVFLKEPLTSKEVMKSVTPKKGVDSVYEGKNVIYFSRLIRKKTQSHLIKIITLPFYQNMTIRNWNTTSKVLELMMGGENWFKNKEYYSIKLFNNFSNLSISGK